MKIHMEETEKRNAVWFSRHEPTEVQLEEAEDLGYDIVATEDGIHLGSINIQDESDLDEIVEQLAELIAIHDADAIFGVFPVPIQGRISENMEDSNTEEYVPCFASWNISRTLEGGKPTFSHYEWVQVGQL